MSRAKASAQSLPELQLLRWKRNRRFGGVTQRLTGKSIGKHIKTALATRAVFQLQDSFSAGSVIKSFCGGFYGIYRNTDRSGGICDHRRLPSGRCESGIVFFKEDLAALCRGGCFFPAAVAVGGSGFFQRSQRGHRDVLSVEHS